MYLSALVDSYAQNHSVRVFVGSGDIVLQLASTEIRGDDLAIGSNPIPQDLGNAVLDLLDLLRLSVDWNVSALGNAVDHDLANEKPQRRARRKHALTPASGQQVCDAVPRNTQSPRSQHPLETTSEIPSPVRRLRHKTSDSKLAGLAEPLHRSFVRRALLLP